MANEIAKKSVSAGKGVKKIDKKTDKKGVAKRNIFQKIAKYFSEVYSELKRVTWPSRKDLISYTLAVVVFVVLMSIIVGVLDFVFTHGVKLIVQ